ncbi:MAG: hypothetical protein R2716_10950 [Microthrixaceae bacterium]
MSPQPPPEDPRRGRFDAAISVLGVARVGSLVLALSAVLLGDRGVATVLAALALGTAVLSAPFRVGWLALRWIRRGDLLYGSLAVVLFVLPLVGLTLSRTL